MQYYFIDKQSLEKDIRVSNSNEENLDLICDSTTLYWSLDMPRLGSSHLSLLYERLGTRGR